MSKHVAIAVGTGSQVDSGIDMKLTKQDLIDLVLEETRETLEAQAMAANLAFNTAEAALKATKETCENKAEEAIRNLYKKEIKMVETHGKMRVTRDSGAYVVAGKVMSSDEYTKSEERQEHKYGERKYGKTSSELIVVTSAMNISNGDTFGTRRQQLISLELYVSLPASELKKVYAPLAEKMKEVETLRKVAYDLRDQVRGVDTMGKKAKAQLIRRILDSSTDGQSVLANLGQMKANVSAMLLQSSKK